MACILLLMVIVHCNNYMDQTSCVIQCGIWETHMSQCLLKRIKVWSAGTDYS